MKTSAGNESPRKCQRILRKYCQYCCFGEMSALQYCTGIFEAPNATTNSSLAKLANLVLLVLFHCLHVWGLTHLALEGEKTWTTKPARL